MSEGMMRPRAAIAYNDMRRALVAVDSLSDAELSQLRDRAEQAGRKYPPVTLVQQRENQTLLLFASYCEETIEERRGTGP